MPCGEPVKRKAIVLVDSGSTHNFVSWYVVNEFGLTTETTASLRAGIASGLKLLSSRKCLDLDILIQGYNFKTDFHIIPLNDYDLGLEAKWLREIWSVWWDFNDI